MPRKKPSRSTNGNGSGKPTGHVVATDVVMWGLVDGDGHLPTFLAANREHAQIVLGSLPEKMRDKLTLARTYVTIQILEGRRRPVHLDVGLLLA